MLPVADDLTCKNVNGWMLFVDSDNMICAGGQGRGGCQVKIEDSDIVYIVVFMAPLLTCKRDVALGQKTKSISFH